MSAQLEDGYTRVANEIAEAMAKLKISNYESRFLWCLFRKTYGYHKKEDFISLTQFEKMTGIASQHIARTKKSLLARNIIYLKGKKIGFVKDVPRWVVPNQVVPNKVTGSTSLGSKSVPIQVLTKEKKENIQKKTEDFVSLLNWWNTKFKTSYRTNPPNKKYLEIFSRWIENGGNIQDIKVAKVLSEHNPRWGKGIGIDSLLRSGKTKDADWVEHFINFEGYEGEAKKFQQEYLSSRNKEV